MRTKHAIDYCPFCAVDHVIGQHPHEGETRIEYLQRMRREARVDVCGAPACHSVTTADGHGAYCEVCGETLA